MEGWRFLGTSSEGSYSVAGVDVWRHRWQRRPLELASVTDPSGNQRQFPVYTIAVLDVAAGDRSVTFAADEVSNGVWAFYVPLESSRGQ
jgi:hypothetical protein